MFTGLIQRIGKVRRVWFGRGMGLEISFEPWAKPLTIGESVAVNGVCLTVARCDQTRFTADVLDETRACSTLGNLVPGKAVNLERAVRAGDPLGGHLVQGHVDACGTVLAVTQRGRDVSARIHCGAVIAAATVPKGSITVDGVSLTVSSLGADWLTVELIPETRRQTTLGQIAVGLKVNLESDVVGRYLHRAAQPSVPTCPPSPASGLTMETLMENGFV